METHAIEKEIQKQLAMWITRNANRNALITITSVVISQKIRHAEIRISVLPDQYENDAIRFLTKHAGEIKGYLQQHMRGITPKEFSWVIDMGAKNQDRIYEILAKEKGS